MTDIKAHLRRSERGNRLGDWFVQTCGEYGIHSHEEFDAALGILFEYVACQGYESAFKGYVLDKLKDATESKAIKFTCTPDGDAI